jgi:plastocyanin
MIKRNLSRGVLCVAFFGTLGWAASIHAKNFTPAADETAAGVEIKIDNFNFMPQDTTVAAGTTITWVNRDDVPHTVVSTNGKFKSKALDTDDKFAFTFSEPGTYEYFCSVHPKMTAKVIVK